MRGVQLEDVPDERSALAIPAAGGRAGAMHGVEDASLYRLQPITHVRQRPADDNGHRVLHVGGLHLLLEASRNDGSDVVLVSHCSVESLLVPLQDHDGVVPAEAETI